MRNGAEIRANHESFAPGRDRSSTVSAIGVTTSCCSNSTGATSEASPSTYIAIGMPRFPELT